MQYTVGKVKITSVVEIASMGGTRFLLPQATPEKIRDMPWLIPAYANAEGRTKLLIQSWIVETPDNRIVVDTCLGNGKERRGMPTWNNLNLPFIADMTAAGYPPDTIDMVICTHLHVDHVGWNTTKSGASWVPTFKNARYVFGKTEFEHWRDKSDTDEHKAIFADSVKPIVDAGLSDLVASDARLSDEITLIPTPGHSPGHMCVHIKSDGEEAVLAGDVAHHPCQMARLDWSSTADFDPVQSIAARKELYARFAGTPTLMFGGHFDPGRVVRDSDAFRLVPA